MLGHAELFVGKDRKWKVSGGDAGYKNNAYQVEHDALFDAIRNDKPYNEAEYGAYKHDDRRSSVAWPPTPAKRSSGIRR